MGELTGLEPQKVFRFFEEITKIPRGSGNETQISAYLKQFAVDRKLRFVQDEWKNVILFQPASAGYEQEPALIIQGHMDMVAVKDTDCNKDLRVEGLDLGVEGDYIYAKGTSLGGDDGIALAYALAILDSEEIKHPALEVVFTVDEEVGMGGADRIDLSVLTGNRLLNLDSEEEGIFLASCAGGARVKCMLRATGADCGAGMADSGNCRILHLSLDGLLGGHSGEEIDKGRGNANKLFGRILYRVCERYPVRLLCVEGGVADNAIPRSASGKILLPPECEGITELITKTVEEIRGELQKTDPGFHCEMKTESVQAPKIVFSAEDTRLAADMLQALPNGVQRMSAEVEGLVETSLNLGILRLGEGQDTLCAEFSVRSSVESAKEDLICCLFSITRMVGGTNEVTGEYPGWQFRADSPFRDKMVRVYREMYGRAPRIEAIHAGLECGLLGSKLKDPDCVSIGPDMHGIHTTQERLSVSSVARVWQYLVKLLETKDENDA